MKLIKCYCSWPNTPGLTVVVGKYKILIQSKTLSRTTQRLAGVTATETAEGVTEHLMSHSLRWNEFSNSQQL